MLHYELRGRKVKMKYLVRAAYGDLEQGKQGTIICSLDSDATGREKYYINWGDEMKPGYVFPDEVEVLPDAAPDPAVS